MEQAHQIWMDGQLVPWADAKVHVLTHTLHYGLGAFEGIRCYKLANGKSAVFRLEEHVHRLFQSAHIAMIPVKWTEKQIVEACLETVRANKLEECYLRPLIFLGDAEMGLYARNNPTRHAIAAWKWGAYLGDEALAKGIRAKVSSFCRPSVNSIMAKGKIVGHYVNSILAKGEAVTAGYQEAIMLDPEGYVSEASGENIFVIREGKVATPPFDSPILGGITRSTVLSLFGELGIPVEERRLTRDELYLADEVFLCGTAAEVTPVWEIDDRKVGSGARGPITQQLQELYFKVVKGVEGVHPEWRSLV